ncbi:MAG: diacylglycerol kinase family lipid kinase [Actinomycetota bacterium]|nr:diacylglycerol kinase family lipid kinase [Actinomycetota bacterium]
MTSPYGSMLLIANPAAGRGRDPVLPRLRTALEARGLDHEVRTTRGPGHAGALAREAIEERGIRFIVAVGGDGTVHEIVNGIVDPEPGARGDHFVLGVVPAGSGCDFARTFGLDRSPERLARHLDGAEFYPIDLGRVRLNGRDDLPRTVLFANVAEAGYGGVVVERANRLPRFLGASRYLFGVFAAIRHFGVRPARLVLDHTEVSGTLSNLVVANGQFFGGGMKVAPRAVPDDGRFNVQLWRGSPKDVFLMTPRIRKGEHVPHPEIQEYQSSRVEVHADEPLLVEADGEVLGTTSAIFDLLPKALNLKI